MPVDIEKTLVNQPTVGDLTEIICRQLEDIKRLENVLKHYDWIETKEQLPSREEYGVLAQRFDNLVITVDCLAIIEEPKRYPRWCRMRPISRRRT